MTDGAAMPIALPPALPDDWRGRQQAALWLREHGYHLRDAQDGNGVWLAAGRGCQWFPSWSAAYHSVRTGNGALFELQERRA